MIINPLCLILIMAYSWQFALCRHIDQPDNYGIESYYPQGYSAYGYAYSGHSPCLPSAYNPSPYQSYPYTPPGTYYDERRGILRPFAGGGVPVLVDYNKRCSNQYVGLKAHPDQPQYYYVCKPDSVIFGKCQNLQVFNATCGQCVQHPRPEYMPICSAVGRFPIYSDCHIYFRCKEDLQPQMYACPENMIFSPAAQTCVTGTKCATTRISDKSSVIPKYCENKYPPCYENGNFRSPVDCSLYYSCELQSNGVYLQTRGRCADGNFYDVQQDKCLPKKQVPCDCIQVDELVHSGRTLFYYPTTYPLHFEIDSLENKPYPIEKSVEASPKPCTTTTQIAENKSLEQYKTNETSTTAAVVATISDKDESAVLDDDLDIRNAKDQKENKPKIDKDISKEKEQPISNTTTTTTKIPEPTTIGSSTTLTPTTADTTKETPSQTEEPVIKNQPKSEDQTKNDTNTTDIPANLEKNTKKPEIDSDELGVLDDELNFNIDDAKAKFAKKDLTISTTSTSESPTTTTTEQSTITPEEEELTADIFETATIKVSTTLKPTTVKTTKEISATTENITTLNSTTPKEEETTTEISINTTTEINTTLKPTTAKTTKEIPATTTLNTTPPKKTRSTTKINTTTTTKTSTTLKSTTFETTKDITTTTPNEDETKTEIPTTAAIETTTTLKPTTLKTTKEIPTTTGKTITLNSTTPKEHKTTTEISTNTTPEINTTLTISKEESGIDNSEDSKTSETDSFKSFENDEFGVLDDELDFKNAHVKTKEIRNETSTEVPTIITSETTTSLEPTKKSTTETTTPTSPINSTTTTTNEKPITPQTTTTQAPTNCSTTPKNNCYEKPKAAETPCETDNPSDIPRLDIIAERRIDIHFSICPKTCDKDHKHSYGASSNRAVYLKWYPHKSNQTLSFETSSK